MALRLSTLSADQTRMDREHPPRYAEPTHSKVREPQIPKPAGLMQRLPIGAPCIKAVNITKRFPSVVANDHVCLDVRLGEIHAILGENGAGKSTLMNILYGLYHPDEGSIYIGDAPVIFRSPRDAIRHGIGMVHQRFMLIPTFTVKENVILGLRSTKRPLLDTKLAEESIRRISDAYGLRVDPDAKIWQLSAGEQQRVEIIKALYREAALLILDEPTSVLTPKEVQDLFSVLKSMTSRGRAVIFITHKLDEALSVSDRVTVLRSGRVVSTTDARKTNKQQLARMMVGHDLTFATKETSDVKKPVVLRVSNLAALSDRSTMALKDASFDLHCGEILGIAGVAGNGQTELAEVIYGLRKANAGTTELDGEQLTNKSTREIMDRGVSYVAEDGLATSLFLDFSIAENLILHSYDKPPIATHGYLNWSEAKKFAHKLVQDLDIRVTSLDAPAKVLSGGNLQRLLVAREFARKPKVLIAAQPTKGLDVDATEHVRSRLIEQAHAGTGVLLISEELEEVTTLSDRIAVIYNGRIAGVVPTNSTSIEEIGLMMTGSKHTIRGEGKQDT